MSSTPDNLPDKAPDAAQPDSTPPVFFQIPLEPIHFPDGGCQFVIEASLGVGPSTDNSAQRHVLRLLVDTGANISVLDRDRAVALLGQAALSTSDLQTMDLQQVHDQTQLVPNAVLAFEGLALPARQMLVVDLGNANRMYKELGKPPIDGFLGGDLLLELRAEIDYRLAAIRVQPPSL